MTFDALVALIAAKKIELSVSGASLKIRASEPLSDEVRRSFKEHKPRLLEWLAGADPSASAHASSEVDGVLSSAQERMWFLHEVSGGGPQYNIHFVAWIAEPIDKDVLEKAFHEVLRRHEPLRTAIVTEGGRPRAVLCSHERFVLAFTDQSSVDREARRDEVRRLSRAESVESFDLAGGRLLRAHLVTLAPDEHALLVTQHHVATDGMSIRVLVRELKAAYAALLAGERSPLPPLGIRYSEFAAWQRRELSNGAVKDQIRWWKEQLDGLPPLVLPSDRPAPPRRTTAGADHSFKLSAELTTELRRLARSQGATPFVTLCAAFASVLHRHSGQAEFGLGTVVAGRSRPELAGLIGCFINTLVLRCDFRGDPSFADVVARMRTVIHGALEHQDAPFEHVVRATGASRGGSLTPLVRANIVMEDGAAAREGRSGAPWVLESTLDGAVDGTAKFDLSLILKEEEGRLIGNLQYTKDLFEPATIARMVGHLERLLVEATSDPAGRVSRVALVTAHEREALRSWNETRRSRDEDCLHALFERQAARTPDAVAALFEDTVLTYRSLDERANQLAHRLRRVGVRPDHRVAVCVDRSLEMLVAVLGVLKAGGAYIPLDPALPEQRLAFMLEDSRPAALVTHHRWSERFGASCGAVIVAVDDPTLSEESRARPVSEATSRHLAYLIYTSGSTGAPKGVEIEHHSAVNLVLSLQEHADLRLGPHDRFLAITTLSFDIAMAELFWPLANGASVEIVARPVAVNAAALAEHVTRSKATILQGTPTTWSLLLEVGWPGKPGMKALTAGEPLAPTLAAELLRRCGSLFNLYGPTETTVFSTLTRVEDEDVTIGRPLGNTTLHVLDDGMNHVPIGAVGELFIGGAGVARAYHDRRELTAERFLPDPFVGGAARMYRTGDLARFRGDGRVEHLGRNDHQIKLRGIRIELGEIEAALRRHPTVASAAVVLREGRLVGYVVLSSPKPSAAELRSFAAEHLPEAMVPSAFVILDALPQTASGKVDRNALPAPGLQELSKRSFVHVETEIERTIASTWAETLGLERVGREDHFFELGGHSLLVVKVHALLRSKLPGVSLTLTDLFEHPTVARLARHLSRGEVSAVAPAVSAPTPALSVEPIAILGMSCRFPGADGIHAFWQNLRNGVESVHTFSDDELRAAGIAEEVIADPSYVKRRPVLPRATMFDASFFGMSPREAEITEPSHRLFLECAWEALEDAGYAPRGAGRVGVYAGVGPAHHAALGTSGSDTLRERYGFREILLGTMPDFVATRVAYKLDLTGPAVSLQAACSTSLVAIVSACQSLLSGACDMAVAGGASAFPSIRGYWYREGDVGSPDGHCRTFDAASQGTAFGDGAGAVVLKRLSDARRDGDRIQAIIRGFGLNNDGSDKVSFAAPSVGGQMGAIREALVRSGVHPDTIGYVEAHGTATRLGDPIEVAALTKVYREWTERRGYCAIGSVKTNIGHVDAAAGVAGVIKTVLSLQNRQIPPSLNFERPNPHIDFASSPFFVNAALRSWASDGPRRAGVSAFGIGGTNAHIVLEEAPPVSDVHGHAGAASRTSELLVFSGRTATAVQALAERYARHLRDRADLALGDVCHTSAIGRTHFEHRAALLVTDREQAAGDLEAIARGEMPASAERGSTDAARRPMTAFLFSGQGSQYVGMGRALFEAYPIFRSAVERCAAVLDRSLERPVLDVLFGQDAEAIHATAYAQTTLFVLQMALTELWASFGVRPDAVLGHSVGEIAAACASGVFSLEDGLALVSARGALMQALPAGGAMLSVRTDRATVEAAVSPHETTLSIAAVNAPDQLVVSGAAHDVEALEAAFSRGGILTQRLQVSHAFHSPLMRPMLAEFRRVLEAITYRSPAIPIFSTVHGARLEGEIATADYWIRHVMDPVRFFEGITSLAETAPSAFVEIGPRRTLLGLARACLSGENAAFVPSLPSASAGDAWESLARGLAQLYVRGVSIEWSTVLAPLGRRRVELPSYPFERRDYWVAPSPSMPRTDVAARPGEGTFDGGGVRPRARLDLTNVDALVKRGTELASLSAPESAILRRALEALRRSTVDGVEGLEEETSASETHFADELRRRPPEERSTVLAASLRDEIAGILRVDAAVLVDDASLLNLGMDSLAGIELRARLRRRLQIDAPTTLAFTHPTFADVRAFVLAQWREQERLDVPPEATEATLGPSRTRSTRAPLSPLQRGLWVLEQVSHGAPFGNLPLAVRIRGPLDERSLEAALHALVERHAALRTVFRDEGGVPFALVRPRAVLDLSRVALDELSSEEQSAKWRELCIGESLRPFDLQEGPLVRFVLVRSGPRDHRLLSVWHHIAFDGWSHGVFSRDLSVLYSSLVVAGTAAHAPLEISYAEHARAYEERLSGDRLASLKDYWREALDGLDEPTELPTDRPRPRERTNFAARTLHINVPLDVTRRVGDLGRSAGASLFMTLLAAFDVLLFRASARTDLCVGTPIACRAEPGSGELIGMFVNSLPLRIDLAGEPTFVEVLRRVVRCCVGAYEHAELPFSTIVEQSDVARDPLRHPLFQTLFALQTAVSKEVAGDVEFELEEVESGTIQFDVAVHLFESPEGLRGRIRYRDDLFDEATLRSAMEDYVRVLEAVVARPDERITALPLTLATTAIDRPSAIDAHGFVLGRRVRRRGLVVDLERLEAALREHRAIADVVVQARHTSHPERDPLVVAYVVSRAALTLEELVRHSERTFGADAGPDHHVVLSALPVTSSGRLDRRRLAVIPVFGPRDPSRFEAELRRLRGVRDAAVVVERTRGAAPRWHVDEVLGGRSTSNENEAEARAPVAEVPRVPERRAPSMTHGPPLPTSLGERTLIDLFESQAATVDKHLVFLREDGGVSTHAYAAFAAEVRSTRLGLRAMRLEPRSPVIVRSTDAETLVRVFWACVLGGHVPLLFPATATDGGRGFDALRPTWELLGRPCVIVDDDPSVAQLSAAQTPELRVASAAGLRASGAGRPADEREGTEASPSTPGDVAAMFLTSGSTGTPKAVMLRHRNIVGSVVASAEITGLGAADVSLNWMPLDHPGPLIRCVIRNFLLGATQIHASPRLVLRDPLAWLDLVERYRVTTTWAPNFAFSLVNECATEIGRRRWDLGSLRSILNTAEPISLATAARFHELLAPHGLRSDAMHASWGMAETASGVTFSRSFLGAPPDGAGASSSAVDLGGPMAGASLRVVDDARAVVPEGTVGNLEVSGATLMAGYHADRAGTDAVVHSDGWFSTGDLARLVGGRLHVVGRAKDTIIVRGGKTNPADIELAVGEIEGVEPSFVCAFAVRRSEDERDRLAILFAPVESTPRARCAALMDEIRRVVGARFLMTPDHVVPVAKSDITKTSIGKVERGRLREQFLSGDFDEQVRQADLLTENARTLPSWFFRVCWRRRWLPEARPSDARRTIVFADSLGLADEVVGRLRACGSTCVRVLVGESFAEGEPGLLRIDGRSARDYERVLAAAGPAPRIVHLLAYADETDDADGELERATASMLTLVRAVARALPGRSPSLIAGAKASQRVRPGDRPCPERAAAIAILRTASQEIPGLTTRHVDLEGDDIVRDAERFVAELLADQGEPEVAYRSGMRHVARLVRHEPRGIPSAPWMRGGFYVIAGGLGGIGTCVARHLLEQYGAKVLILGRRPPTSTLRSDVEALSHVGDVAYEAVDVGNASALMTAVQRASSRWGTSLHGAINATGEARRSLLADEDEATLRRMCGDRRQTNRSLHALLRAVGGRFLVTFSSVNGFFGGALAGAYAAACRWVDAWAESLAGDADGPPVHACAFSAWEGVGMRRGEGPHAAAAARGYRSIEPRQGLASLPFATSAPAGHVLIGLDGDKEHIEALLSDEARPLSRWQAFVAVDAGVPESNREILRAPLDPYGSRATCTFVEVTEVPRREDGSANVARFMASGGLAPERPIEKTLATIWRSVLGARELTVDDNFFGIGGDSLGAVRFVTQAERAGLPVTADDLFRHPTIARLADALERRRTAPRSEADDVPYGEAPLTPIQRRFFEQERIRPDHFSHFAVFEVPSMEVGALREAIRIVCEHHDVLRTRFERTDAGWTQRIDERAAAFDFELGDAHPPGVPDEEILERAVEAATTNLRLATTAPVRFILVPGRDRPGRLVVAMHHLVSDGHSWALLREDIGAAYAALTSGAAPRLPAKTTSFRRWARELDARKDTDAVTAEGLAWRHRTRRLHPLPTDLGDRDENRFGSVASVEISLTSSEVSDLVRSDVVAQGGREASLVDRLLGALAIAVARWTASDAVGIDVSTHARDPRLLGLDVSRTLGYFTAISPIVVLVPTGGTPQMAVASASAEMERRGLGGLAYGLLRHSSRDDALAREVRGARQPEIAFHYLGHRPRRADHEGAAFRVVASSVRPRQDPRERRPYLLEVVATGTEDGIELELGYSTCLYRADSIERLAADYGAALAAIARV